jgi:hypothetical protein
VALVDSDRNVQAGDNVEFTILSDKLHCSIRRPRKASFLQVENGRIAAGLWKMAAQKLAAWDEED